MDAYTALVLDFHKVYDPLKKRYGLIYHFNIRSRGPSEMLIHGKDVYIHVEEDTPEQMWETATNRLKSLREN